MTSAAGSRAQEQVDRLSRRESELIAELERVRSERARWAAGAEGERAVGAVLDDLRSRHWYALHDVHWPGRPKANLDHVLVGPGGVVVVDAKNWSGAVDVQHGMLRVDGRRKPDVLAAAARAESDLMAVTPVVHRSLVRSAVCFVGSGLAPYEVPPGVVLVGLHHLPGWLLSLPPALPLSEIAPTYEHLRQLLTGARSPALPPVVGPASLPGDGYGAQQLARQREVAQWDVAQRELAQRGPAPRRGRAPRHQSRAPQPRPPRPPRPPRRRSSRRPSSAAPGSSTWFALLMVAVVVVVCWQVLQGLTTTTTGGSAPAVTPTPPVATAPAAPGAPAP